MTTPELPAVTSSPELTAVLPHRRVTPARQLDARDADQARRQRVAPGKDRNRLVAAGYRAPGPLRRGMTPARPQVALTGWVELIEGLDPITTAAATIAHAGHAVGDGGRRYLGACTGWSRP